MAHWMRSTVELAIETTTQTYKKKYQLGEQWETGLRSFVSCLREFKRESWSGDFLGLNQIIFLGELDFCQDYCWTEDLWWQCDAGPPCWGYYTQNASLVMWFVPPGTCIHTATLILGWIEMLSIGTRGYECIYHHYMYTLHTYARVRLYVCETEFSKETCAMFFQKRWVYLSLGNYVENLGWEHRRSADLAT
jgi:hypothetical protein